MKYLLSCLILVLFVNSAFSQKLKTDKFRDNIKKEAEIMTGALVNKKYDVFVKYIYPPMLTKMGGKEKFTEVLKKGMSEGGGIKSIKLGYPSDTIMVKNEIQCTIKEDIEIIVSGGKMLLKTTIVGISANKGKSWYFFDANSANIAKFRQDFPNLSSRLVFEQFTQPKFIKD